jgi:hypothetical protein
MFGSVATWKIRAPFGSPSDQEAFIRDLVQRGIKEARAQGVIDVFMGALAPDLLTIISLFETEDEAVAADEVAKRFVAREYRDSVEVIDKAIGPAFELRQFIDVDPADFPTLIDSPEPLVAQFVAWRLSPAMQSPDHLEALLTRVWHDSFPELRAVGLCDICSVQIRPDELLTLRLFSPGADENPLFQAAIAGKEHRFHPHAVVERVRVGLGWDSQLLLDYRPWQCSVGPSSRSTARYPEPTDIRGQGPSVQRDRRTVDHDERLEGTEGIPVLDNGAILAVTDWVINIVVTQSGETLWTAHLHVPDELAIPALLSADRDAGQCINGEKVKFLGTLITN